MKSRRRFLTFSLRTLFVAMTVLAIWLGVVVNRAREQHEAVKAIEALGGRVEYDWEQLRKPHPSGKGSVSVFSEPHGPRWLRRLIGDDFFQEVDNVWLLGVPEPDILKAIPELQRLHRPTYVAIFYDVSNPTQGRLKAALQNCELHLDYYSQ